MKFEISPKEYETELNWQESILYCTMLDIDGYGWRLPTKDELKEIYKTENDFIKDFYWSSTESRASIHAWCMNFNIGFRYINGKTNHYYVRAIRDL